MTLTMAKEHDTLASIVEEPKSKSGKNDEKVLPKSFKPQMGFTVCACRAISLAITSFVLMYSQLVHTYDL